MDWDTIGYHHMAQQLILGNYNSIFNETWSPLFPAFLALISKGINVNFFISEFIIESVSLLLLFTVLNKRKLISRVYEFILILPLLLLPIGCPDLIFGVLTIVFLSILSELLENRLPIKRLEIFKLVLIGILMIFSKGTGIVVFFGTLILSLLVLIHNKWKNNGDYITNQVKVLLAVIIGVFSFTLSWVKLKEYRLQRKASWSSVDNYNLSIINLNKISFNKRDHWDNICEYGYTPDLFNLNKYNLSKDSRAINQFSWLDIAWHNKSNNKNLWDTYFSDTNYFKYAIANIWIIIKEYFAYLILLLLLFKYLNLNNLIFVVPTILQLLIVVLVHIEERFLNVFFVVLLLLAFKNLNIIMDNRRRGIIMMSLGFTLFPSCFMFTSLNGSKINEIIKKDEWFDLTEPQFINQKLPSGNYLLERKVENTYCVINNPDVFLHTPGGNYKINDLKKLKLIDNKYVVEESN